jgi:SnoaL-like domain
MTEPTLARLWAVHEIEQLAARYAHAFATHDRELMLSLWARTESPARLPAVDLHRISRDIDRWWESLGQVMLLITSHVIDLHDDDHASGAVYCLGQIDTGHQFVDQTIVYHDRYVRSDDHWRFATREHLLWFGQTRERHPLHQPAAHWPRRQVGTGVNEPAQPPSASTVAQGDPR